MSHSFEKKRIPTGETFVDIVCRKCGQKARKYKNGNHAYHQADGTIKAGKTPCNPFYPWIEVALQPPQPGQIVAFLLSTGELFQGEYVGNHGGIHRFMAESSWWAGFYWTPIPAIPSALIEKLTGQEPEIKPQV